MAAKLRRLSIDQHRGSAVVGHGKGGQGPASTDLWRNYPTR